jgi:putative transposase
MANTYTQLYIQIVFSVKNRKALIANEFEERLYQYITGIIRKRKNKLIAINGMPDHIHIFIGLDPSQCLSDLVREIKKASTNKINELKLTKGKFEWQAGYGAFTYSASHIDKVVKYILNQKNHHKKKSFKTEYLQLLKAFEIEYNDQYLFDWFDDLY